MRYTLFILTDCNRKTLHLGVTSTLSQEIQRLKEYYSLFMDASSILGRLVYQESFASEQAALDRYKQYMQFTRMQSERLIRRQNPNWLDQYQNSSENRSSVTIKNSRTWSMSKPVLCVSA